MSQVHRLVSLKRLLGTSLKQSLIFRVLEDSSDAGRGQAVEIKSPYIRPPIFYQMITVTVSYQPDARQCVCACAHAARKPTPEK